MDMFNAHQTLAPAVYAQWVEQMLRLKAVFLGRKLVNMARAPMKLHQSFGSCLLCKQSQQSPARA